MSRPRLGTQQVWYDTFMDWPLDDQRAAIRMLQELHRQKERITKKGDQPNGTDDTQSQ